MRVPMAQTVAMAQTVTAEKKDTITQIKELKGSEYMYVSETRRGQKARRRARDE